MAVQVIDNCGLACPEPVIRTKRALDAITEGTVVSVVDNQVARDNVLRLVQSMGLTAAVETDGQLYRITIAKGTAAAESCQCTPMSFRQTSVLLVQSELMGEGDPQLGHVLMRSFFHALSESSDLPTEIFFVNGGVKLTCQGSPVLERLRTLEQRGVQMMSCGTCLDFYHLKEQLAIGGITNMYTIVESLFRADRTIRL